MIFHYDKNQIVVATGDGACHSAAVGTLALKDSKAQPALFDALISGRTLIVDKRKKSVSIISSIQRK